VTVADEQHPVIWLRPEQSPVGRRAERSRAEITAAAIEIADREGLDAVSMRRVAADLGTGAASLYRYVATRDELLDLMVDSTGGEYRLAAPRGDWPSDLLDVARQAREIMRRHPWLPALVVTRPVLGPRGADVLEHVLDVLSDHPATPARKLEAFALLSGLPALFVQHERAEADAGAARQAVYLQHVAAGGDHPNVAALLASTPAGDDSRELFDVVGANALAGVLS
jgi:AcrR family transcriptional regulator